MEKLLRGKVVGGKMLEGYNSFMYKDSNKRNERILAKRTTIQNEMERQQQQKAAEKAARKAEKQAQKEQAKAEREQKRLERQAAIVEENTEEDENRRVFFGKEDEEEVFEATVIDINQLVDDKYSKFEKSPKGMDLLKRNLKSSRLYIDDDGDLLKVQEIKEVEAEMQDISKVYLLLDTNREYFVVEFSCIRTF